MTVPACTGALWTSALRTSGSFFPWAYPPFRWKKRQPPYHPVLFRYLQVTALLLRADEEDHTGAPVHDRPDPQYDRWVPGLAWIRTGLWGNDQKPALGAHFIIAHTKVTFGFLELVAIHSFVRFVQKQSPENLFEFYKILTSRTKSVCVIVNENSPFFCPISLCNKQTFPRIM